MAEGCGGEPGAGVGFVKGRGRSAHQMRFCRKEKERSVIKLLTIGNGRFFVPSYTCPYAFIQHEYPPPSPPGARLAPCRRHWEPACFRTIAYAETKPAAAEESVQEMPERVMTIRSQVPAAETVSSATLTNMKTEEVPQTVNVITRDLMDSKGSDCPGGSVAYGFLRQYGWGHAFVPYGGPVHHSRLCRQ